MAKLTKYGNYSTVQIPPDSTGSKIHHREHYTLQVNGLIPPSRILPWALVSSGGATGFVHSFGNIESSLSHRLNATFNFDSPVTEYAVGETLTLTASSGATSVVTIVAVEAIKSSAVVLSSGVNSDNFLSIDKAGAAFVRFSEGAQQLDAKGLTRTSSPTVLMDVHFISGVNDDIAYGAAVNNASRSFLPSERLLALDVDVGVGDAIVKRSNRYSFFQSGFASIYETAVAIGDTGKPNVIRRWGYYDDTDGLFFELNESTVNVVIRSSVSGTVEELRVPQSRWNNDKLNGTGQSAIDLNVALMNNYFIDFSGYAAGKIRFGIMGPAGRIICHEIFYGNAIPSNIMRTAMLPVTWEQFNTGISPSPSRMKTSGATVMNDGAPTPESQITIASNFTWVAPTEVTATGNDWKYIASVRSGKYVPGTGGTVINRKSTIPQKLAYHITGGPVLLQIRAGAVPIGAPAFQAAAPGSVVEIDVDGTFSPIPQHGGLPVMTRMYAPGQYTIDPPQNFNVRGNGMSLRSDGEFGSGFTFIFKPLNPTDSVTFLLALDWIDI